MPLLARNDRAHSSRRGVFHHLCIFNLETQISFFKGTGSLAGATCQYCTAERKGATAQTDALGLQLSFSPKSLIFFQLQSPDWPSLLTSGTCSNIFLMLHLIYRTLSFVVGDAAMLTVHIKCQLRDGLSPEGEPSELIKDE